MKFRTILFDLDGTLLDTNELILASFLHTLDLFYPGKYRREDIVPHMGKTLWEQMRIFGPEQPERLVEVYREHNLRMHDEMIAEFPHVREVLAELHRNGFVLGVVTSKQRVTAKRGLERFGLEAYFQLLVTFDDTDRHKPDPSPVLLAMEKLGSDPRQTLMVGDSPCDIEAAHRAGIAAAAVRWSLKPEELLMAAQPEFMLSDMRDLLALVGLRSGSGK